MPKPHPHPHSTNAPTNAPETPPNFRPADDSGVAVPSRLLLLEALARAAAPATLAQLCAEFEMDLHAADGAAARATEARLARMCAHGLVLHDRKGRYALPAKMDLKPGRVSGHANGYGFVIPDDGSDDLFLHHRQMRRVLHGDRVLARVKSVDARGRKEGAVVEVLVDAAREIIGHFHLESGAGFVEPDDSRHARDITIPPEARGGANDGDIVVARVIRHPVEHGHAVGEVTEVMGGQLQPGMETDIAIRKHDIPAAWPAEVDAELRAMGEALSVARAEAGRQDLRELPLLTIDGEDARDFDDAVYCERGDGGGWRLVVAIADVSQYVRRDGALDREALRRGNSVYFPNRVVPMLPRELSNGICSLNPAEDRHCMVCDMQLTAAGEVRGYRFYRALMHSKARLTYTEVHAIVSTRDPAARERRREVAPHLDDLFALYRVLAVQRRERGTVDFEFPEARFEFDARQKISRIHMAERNHAHRLIEECMLTANQCAAQYLQQHFGKRAMYRNHDGPTAESLGELRQFLGGLGLQLGGGEQPAAADYARLVEQAATKPEIAPLVQIVLLRSLSQAVYAAEPRGHFALAYPAYTHFTSPIRRYPDLVVHRLLGRLIDRDAGGVDDDLDKIAEQCSFTERRAEDAGRDVIAWLKAEFMQDKVGAEFDGVISGVKEFGVFVQLSDLFVDGLVHVTSLGDDYYHFDPLRLELRGERGGRRFRLGDRLRVVVSRVSLDDAKIDFELVGATPPKRHKTTAKRHGKKRKQHQHRKQRTQTTRKPARKTRRA